MADLEDRHADAWQREEISLRLLENVDRKHRRAGGKIEDSSCRSHE
jgi:hypothetical protein